MVRAKVQSLFKIIQVTDSNLCFSHYKLNIESDSEGSINPISDTLVVEDPEDIPELITGMTKFFFGAHPNPKGGNIWTYLSFAYTTYRKYHRG